MTFHDYAAVFRDRWLAIVGTGLVVVFAALAYSLSMTPTYRAEARLFIATAADGSGDAYQGNLASQQRVASYTRLLTGTAIARRTIDALGLTVTPAELSSKVLVTSASNTVIIDLSVSDTSPGMARDIANQLGVQFTELVSELETPDNGGPANTVATVVEQADLPTTSFEPRTLRNLLAGLAIGLLSGLGVAIIRDRLDSTIRDRHALEAATGGTVIGLVPYDDNLARSPIGGLNSTATEPFRRLCYNVKFIDVDNPPEVFVVGSPLPDEGKTTVAINLARALGEAGNRVVLVDADLRRPRVADYLNSSSGAGVTTILTGEASAYEVLQPTGFVNVTVLASGPVPPNPSALLDSQAARLLLAELRSAFDFVVIDAPPLLPVSDATVLAAESDGVLLVAKYAATTRHQAGRAAEMLRMANATLLGVVLTMTPQNTRDDTARHDYPADVQAPSSALKRLVGRER